MGGRSFHETEAPYHLANDAPEWERLDFMHSGIKDYLGNRLSLAELETPPKRILEIGCGSGAWAVQAAQTYPDAEVIAVDISPLPSRPLPDNVKFQMVDVTQPLPFELESFDVVHTRFLLIHLPHPCQVLERFIELVKPGGWILLDEIGPGMLGDTGPAIKKFYEVFYDYMAQRQVKPIPGTLFELTLKESSKFSEVHVQMVSPYFVGGNGGMYPSLDHLGEVMKTSFVKASKAFDPKLIAYGMSDELREAWYQEITDLERKIHVDLFFTWGRKLMV